MKCPACRTRNIAWWGIRLTTPFACKGCGAPLVVTNYVTSLAIVIAIHAFAVFPLSMAIFGQMWQRAAFSTALIVPLVIWGLAFRLKCRVDDVDTQRPTPHS